MVRSCALLLLLALPAVAAAEELPTFRDVASVRAVGMGGAARGFASSGEALLLNPAGIAATTRFNVSANAFFDLPFGHRVLSVDAIDSKINANESFAMAGGIGYYNYKSGDGDEERGGSVVVAGLALPLWPETLFIGISGRYLNLSEAVKMNALTMDAAVMIRAMDLLSLSAIGYNLIDVRSPEARRSWAFGVAVGSDASFHIDFDVRLDPDATGKTVPTYFIGGEVLIADLVMPRIGFKEDKLREARELSAGVSVIVAGFAIEAAYRHALGGEGRGFGVTFRLLDSPF